MRANKCMWNICMNTLECEHTPVNTHTRKRTCKHIQVNTLVKHTWMWTNASEQWHTHAYMHVWSHARESMQTHNSLTSELYNHMCDDSGTTWEIMKCTCEHTMSHSTTQQTYSLCHVHTHTHTKNAFGTPLACRSWWKPCLLHTVSYQHKQFQHETWKPTWTTVIAQHVLYAVIALWRAPQHAWTLSQHAHTVTAIQSQHLHNTTASV